MNQKVSRESVVKDVRTHYVEPENTLIPSVGFIPRPATRGGKVGLTLAVLASPGEL